MKDGVVSVKMAVLRPDASTSKRKLQVLRPNDFPKSAPKAIKPTYYDDGGRNFLVHRRSVAALDRAGKFFFLFSAAKR